MLNHNILFSLLIDSKINILLFIVGDIVKCQIVRVTFNMADILFEQVNSLKVGGEIWCKGAVTHEICICVYTSWSGERYLAIENISRKF